MNSDQLFLIKSIIEEKKKSLESLTRNATCYLRAGGTKKFLKEVDKELELIEQASKSLTECWLAQNNITEEK